MRNRIFPLFLLILPFLSCKSETNPEGTELNKVGFSQLDSLGNRYLELNRFSGTILIAKEDSVIYKNDFGFADYEKARAFSEKTAFKIGRISELVTAQIIHDLSEEAKFGITDKVSDHIPEIESEITIKQLLDHQTEWPSIGTIQEKFPELEYSTIGYVNVANNLPKVSGDTGLEYNLLGLLIERISGMSYEENVEEYSAPLALDNTYFKKQDPNAAVGYLHHNLGNGLGLEESPHYDPRIEFSSAGIKSTASDLLKILRRTSEKAIEIEGYLGNDGFSYSLRHHPQNKTSIIVLSNRRHPVAGEITDIADSILQGRPYSLPLPRKPIDINSELLKEYAGSYALNEDVTLEILRENDSLFVMMGPNKVYLIPQASNQFFMAQRDASLRFLRDSANVVNEVELLDGFLEGNKIKRLKV